MCIRPTALRNRGFTLIEVIVALALMSFIITSVYGIASGAMQLGKSLGESRIRESRLTNFVSAWREYLETLPPNTLITVGEKPTRKFGKGALLFENGSVPFAWSRAVKLAPAVEFKLVRSEDNRQSSDLIVRHLRRPERATSPDDYEPIAELPILQGLREFRWEFYDVEKKKWVTLWEDKPHPPLFMKLKFGFITEPKTYEYVFWFSGGNQANDALPPGQQVPLGQRIPPPTGGTPGGVGAP